MSLVHPRFRPTPEPPVSPPPQPASEPAPQPQPPADPSAPEPMSPEQREILMGELRSIRSEIEALEQEHNMPNDPLAGLTADEKTALEAYRAQRDVKKQADAELRAIMAKPNATLTESDMARLRDYAVEQGRREGWL